MNSTVLALANGPLVGHSTRLIARRSKPALYKAKQSKTGSDEGGTKSRRSESSRALRPALRVHSTRCRWRATYASKSHSTTVERTTYTTHSPTGIELIGREGGRSTGGRNVGVSVAERFTRSSNLLLLCKRNF